jgi:hypothetical protein
MTYRRQDASGPDAYLTDVATGTCPRAVLTCWRRGLAHDDR